MRSAAREPGGLLDVRRGCTRTGSHAGAADAGKGYLGYDLYLRYLSEAGYAGPLALHGPAEKVARSLAFLREKLVGAALGRASMAGEAGR